MAFAQSPPSVEDAKATLQRQLQRLKPAAERNVVFKSVQAGAPSGQSYPFRVTAIVRDYSPGSPQSRNFGETCIGRMEDLVFTLVRNTFGEWEAQGRLTLGGTERTCLANPAEGVSSTPLSAIQ
jgi:hypothetical protein